MLILASGSPRRRQLLDLLRVRYTVETPELDETFEPGELPGETVCRLAASKGAAVAAAHTDRWVLSADTVVAVGDAILGKPTDQAEAVEMLGMLSGQTHQVYTGMALQRAWGEPKIDLSVAAVRFRALNEREIHAYVASREPLDKAGAYAAQGLGGMLIDRIDGELSTVVGLNLSSTVRLLSFAGIPHALAVT